MVEEVRALGPLNWKQVAREPAEVLAALNGHQSDLAEPHRAGYRQQPTMAATPCSPRRRR